MLPMMTPDRERTVRRSNRVLLAMTDGPLADQVRRTLRRLGHRALQAANCTEMRRLLCETPGPVTVILSTDLTDESCWLTSAKLTNPPGRITVLIVGPATPRHRRLARAAGAAALLSDPVALGEWLV